MGGGGWGWGEGWGWEVGGEEWGGGYKRGVCGGIVSVGVWAGG